MSTINISLEFITGQKAACKVIFTPQNGYWVDGHFIVLPMPRHVRTNSDGLATIILFPGSYLLTFEGLGNDGAAGIPVSIPDDNLTYDLSDWIGIPPSRVGEQLRWTDTATAQVYALNIVNGIPTFVPASLGSSTPGESIIWTDTVTATRYHYLITNGIPNLQPV